MQQLGRRSSRELPSLNAAALLLNICFVFVRVRVSLMSMQLPKAADAVLQREFVMFTSKVTGSSVSSDGETVRSLISHCKVVTLCTGEAARAAAGRPQR